MSKKNVKTATAVSSIGSFAGEVADMFQEIVEEKVLARAEIVLMDFARKDDERLKGIAKLNVHIKELQAKLDKAEKVTNQAALSRQIAYAEADVAEIVTLRTAAVAKREAFISSFETDAYAALVDSNLVRSGLDVA